MRIKEECRNFVHLKGKINHIGNSAKPDGKLCRDAELIIDPYNSFLVVFIGKEEDTGYLEDGMSVWVTGKLKRDKEGDMYVISEVYGKN